MDEQEYKYEETGAGGVTLDPERQISARALAAQHRRLMVVELAVAAVLVVGFLLTGASRWLKEALVAAGFVDQWALVAAYVAVLTVSYTIITGPLTWFGGYVLPHRYGLSRQTPAAWLEDELKSLILGLILGIPVAEVVYWLLRSRPETWWIWTGVFMVGFVVILGHLAPVLIVPLFYKLRPLDDPALIERIDALGRRTGTRIVGVYTINLSSKTAAANAMVMGLGRTKRIALGDTLYAAYSPQEIETIIAHELGHQVHHDLELGIAVQTLIMFGGLYLAHLFLDWGVVRFGFNGRAILLLCPSPSSPSACFLCSPCL